MRGDLRYQALIGSAHRFRELPLDELVPEVHRELRPSYQQAGKGQRQQCLLWRDHFLHPCRCRHRSLQCLASLLGSPRQFRLLAQVVRVFQPFDLAFLCWKFSLGN